MHKTRSILFLAAAVLAALPGAASAGVCGVRPACDVAPPEGSRAAFTHATTKLFSGLGARHRARDVFVKAGSPVWAVAKFAYGPTDKDLEDEEVEVYLLKGCQNWSKIATVRTTKTGSTMPALPASVGNPTDKHGRVYQNLGPLPAGRHKVRFFVRGDGSKAEMFVDVLPGNAKIAVTDLDGTQTSSEFASVAQLVGIMPSARGGGAEMLTKLAEKGYYILYLTARPEWFVQGTRDWLKQKNFPAGIVHTTFSLIGAIGSAAVTFKSGELASLKTATGVVPSYGFGNQPTDVDAYKNAGIPMGNTYYLDLGGDLKGGHGLQKDYNSLLEPFGKLESVCH